MMYSGDECYDDDVTSGPHFDEPASIDYGDDEDEQEPQRRYAIEFRLGDTIYPGKYEVCYGCHGKGTHVNRAIDGNGLDPNDPDLDEEFWEMYTSGAYDVLCDTCKGQRVVAVLDEDKATPAQVREVEEWAQEEYEYQRECAAERRAGC